MTRFAWLAVVVLTLGMLGAIPTALATSPGKNGRIVYMVKDGAGHWQAWVANSDLSGAKKLTHGRYDSGWAVWSPEGKRLVFDSNRTDHTPNEGSAPIRYFVRQSRYGTHRQSPGSGTGTCGSRLRAALAGLGCN